MAHAVGNGVSRTHDFDTELTGSRPEIAAVLNDVSSGLVAGSLRFDDGPEAISLGVPEEITLELELEVTDDEVNLELELEWAAGTHSHTAESGGEGKSGAAEATETTESDAAPTADPDPETADASTADGDMETTESPVSVGSGDPEASLARFELFRDSREEWRWRLRHRNGNIIATSGEGYTRKHNARKGLRSVVRNAPGAAVSEEQ